MQRVVAFVKQPLGWLSIIAFVLVAMCCYTGAVMGGLLPSWTTPHQPAAVAEAPLASAPAPEPEVTTVAPLLPEPTPSFESSPTPNPRCHPNYSVCLPIVRKLTCNQIRQRDFDVIGGKDPYGLDPDKDGKACERRRG